VRDVPDDNYDWHFKRAEALGFPSFSDYMRELLVLKRRTHAK
jgi:hypothetical protein